jgi:hypothetical protein
MMSWNLDFYFMKYLCVQLAGLVGEMRAGYQTFELDARQTSCRLEFEQRQGSSLNKGVEGKWLTTRTHAR